MNQANDKKEKDGLHIEKIARDLSGQVAGRDIHNYSDPALQARVSELETKIAQLEATRALMDDESPLLKQILKYQAELAALVATPTSESGIPTSTTLEQLYLKGVQAEVGQVSLLHIDPGAAENRMELAQVYTALMTTGTDEEQAAARENLGREALPRPSALWQLNQHSHLVLLGAPGSGKSTFVNFVVLCLAGERLQGDNQFLDLLRTPLPPKESDLSTASDKEKEPQPQPWDHEALLPLKIVLRKFAGEGLPPIGQIASAKHLWEYVTAQLTQDDLVDYAPILKTHFQQAGGLLLFDGLDEVPDPEQRVPQLRQVIEDIAVRYEKCRLVVTSRPYAYQNKAWQLNDFEETTLAPFSKPQIEHFVASWYHYLGTIHGWTEATQQRRITQLQQAIFSQHRNLRELAERPLLLTLMANLHASRGTLPDKRAELYEETVALLLDRWERGRFSGDETALPGRLSDWLEVAQDKIRALLENLAFDAHAHQRAQVEGTANLDGEKLLGGLLNLTRRDIHPADLLDYLDQRAGILEGQGNNVYRFPHRTFQEYLAGCHLTRGDDFAQKTARLVRTDTTRWREVALLAGAKAASSYPPAIWLLADELCPNPVKPAETNQAELLAALIASEALVETAILTDLSPANTNKVNRIRAWLKHILDTNSLPAIERVIAGKTLAVLGDDRLGVGCGNNLPEISWSDVPAGEFTMGSDDDEREKPPHPVTLPNYQISRYTITNAQFATFVNDGGYTEKWRHCWTETGWEMRTENDWQQPEYWFNNQLNQANQPVVGLSWYEAVAFCHWLSEQLRQTSQLPAGEVIRLPTEAEWEKAARGSKGLIYPWGDEFDSDKANTFETGIGLSCAVGCFVTGVSSYGCQDMAGNVLEWCATQDTSEGDLPSYPYKVVDQWQDAYLEGTNIRVWRGGSFLNYGQYVRSACRSHDFPHRRYNNRGVRIVLAPIGSGS